MIRSLSLLAAWLLHGLSTAGAGQRATMIEQTQCRWMCHRLSNFVWRSSSIGTTRGGVGLAALNSQAISTMAIGCCSTLAFADVSISSRRLETTIFTLVEIGHRFILRPKIQGWQKRGRCHAFATVHLFGATDELHRRSTLLSILRENDLGRSENERVSMAVSKKRRRWQPRDLRWTSPSQHQDN